MLILKLQVKTQSLSSQSTMFSFPFLSIFFFSFVKSLPEWTKKVIPGGEMYDIMEETFLKAFKTDTGTQFLAKIKVGFLLKDIFDRFTNKSKTTLDPDRKLWVYSGHDTTICRFLNTLGLLEVFTQIKVQFF